MAIGTHASLDCDRLDAHKFLTEGSEGTRRKVQARDTPAIWRCCFRPMKAPHNFTFDIRANQHTALPDCLCIVSFGFTIAK